LNGPQVCCTLMAGCHMGVSATEAELQPQPAGPVFSFITKVWLQKRSTRCGVALLAACGGFSMFTPRPVQAWTVSKPGRPAARMAVGSPNFSMQEKNVSDGYLKCVLLLCVSSPSGFGGSKVWKGACCKRCLIVWVSQYKFEVLPVLGAGPRIVHL
jgi:hypothetical protein